MTINKGKVVKLYTSLPPTQFCELDETTPCPNADCNTYATIKDGKREVWQCAGCGETFTFEGTDQHRDMLKPV